MTNPTPAGDQFPGQTPQWSGEPTPNYSAPPQYQPYPPQYQTYQPAGATPPPGATPSAGYSPPTGYPPQYVQGMNPTNPLAIASLIVSLVGIGLVGVILGHIALGQIKRSNGYEQGRGLAIAGLVIGYAQLALGLIFVIFFMFVAIAASTVPTN